MAHIVTPHACGEDRSDAPPPGACLPAATQMSPAGVALGDGGSPIGSQPSPVAAGTPADPAASQRVHLRDGAVVTVRAAHADDEPALRAFLGGLCLEARRLRFFTAAVNLDSAAHWAATLGRESCGLLAVDEADAVVGHAAFIQLDRQRAEVAVEVADHLHGDGLGTILVERLAAIAEQRGISQFLAQVLPENHSMLKVLRDGFDARVNRREGVETVEFPTSAWRLARQRYPDGVTVASESQTNS